MKNSPQSSHIQLWRCPNCGQVHFGDTPPDMCDFCRDFTTWQPINTEEAPTETQPQKQPRDVTNIPSAQQLRLFDDD